MRNGSRSEYYLVEGGLKLTRMRQSEWRRRWGVQGIVTLDLQVDASFDDGWTWDTNSFSNTHADAIIGKSTTVFDSFFRFLNVTIPGGATIQVAYVTAEAGSESLNDNQEVLVNIYADDIDNAVAPTSEAEHDALTRTTAFTVWDGITFADDTPTDSPSIVDVIQEIVDRGSWSSGNALQILIDDDGTTDGRFYRWKSYNHGGGSGNALRLHVEYAA